MRVVPWLILALLLLPLALALPQAAPLPHPGIRIVGDDGFRDPASGVVRGSGTAEDPYVISGWVILPGTSGASLHLEDTTAHVVVERVQFARTGGALQAWTCGDPGWGDGCQTAILLRNVSHVTLRDVVIPHAGIGVLALHARELELERVSIGPGGARLPVQEGDLPMYGIRGYDVPGISLHGVRALARDGIVLDGAGVARFRDVDASSAHVVADALRVEGGSFGPTRSRWSGPLGTTAPARVIGASFAGPGGQLVGPVEFACGNTFQGGAHQWLVSSAPRVRVVGNGFAGAVQGLVLEGERVEFDRNLVRGGTRAAIFGGMLNEVHENAFEGGLVVARGSGELTRNWWGAEEGPWTDRAGGRPPPDQSSFFDESGGEAVVEPWLEARPELKVDCAAEERAFSPG